METRDLIEVTIAVIGGVGAVVISIGYVIGQFRKGQNDRRKDDIENKKGVLDLLKEQVDSLETLCDKQQEEIVILRTQAEEREKKAKEYVEIFQNRNPEMLAFMKYLTDTAKASNEYMKDTATLFVQLKQIMETLAKHLEEPNN